MSHKSSCICGICCRLLLAVRRRRRRLYLYPYREFSFGWSPLSSRKCDRHATSRETGAPETEEDLRLRLQTADTDTREGQANPIVADQQSFATAWSGRRNAVC